MPTYDYVCDTCGHSFEHFQSMTAAPLKACPKCAKKSLKRLIGTGAGVIFKGEGFYITDYRSESYKKAAEAEKAPAKTETPAAGDAGKPAASDTANAPKDSPAPAAKPAPAAASPAAKSEVRPRKRKAV
jgi:putative FmdB family regulatory protein